MFGVPKGVSILLNTVKHGKYIRYEHGMSWAYFPVQSNDNQYARNSCLSTLINYYISTTIKHVSIVKWHHYNRARSLKLLTCHPFNFMMNSFKAFWLAAQNSSTNQNANALSSFSVKFIAKVFYKNRSSRWLMKAKIFTVAHWPRYAIDWVRIPQ